MVFFRLGDFYEMFFEDALEGSKILGITLTARTKGDGVKAPMCSVPYHAVDNYISKLTKAGKKVAICDQITEPDGKEIVEREVIRVITPGTTFDNNILDKKSNNYISALTQNYDGYGFAYSDVTTGEFFVTEFFGLPEVVEELARLRPSEIIMPQSLIDNEQLIHAVKQFKDLSYFSFESFNEPEKVLAENFGIKSISVFGLEDKKSAIQASALLYEYLKETQKTDLKHIESIKFYTLSEFIPLSESTISNLEIFRTLRDGQKEGSLLYVLDKTSTAMGGRKLRNFMIHPLLNRGKIIERLDGIQELLGKPSLLKDIREELSKILDIERILSRLSLGTGNARDLIALKESLKKIPAIKDFLKNFESLILKDVEKDLIDMDALILLVEKAIKDEPPHVVREGNMIRDGYNQELDDLRSINTEGKTFVSNMQKREIQRTGISSLKIKYNKVFGYYIEISNANLKNVPEDYIRKQTLVNAERFITPELKEYEDKILHSIDRICELEYELFYEVRMKVVENISEIKRISDAIARLDVVCGFAEVALMNNYCRPEILEDVDPIGGISVDEKPRGNPFGGGSVGGSSLGGGSLRGGSVGIIDIKQGRHPVLESLNASKGFKGFVPNDCLIDPEKNILTLITGPNMGGKSVYIKQVALIVYLAHIGSYVSASSCRLGLVDQIFTRVGASDNLTKGESTFMIEMIEASYILHNATSKSLIILDEIGRGTSTYDGLSIAWAVCEFIHDKLKTKTLFATHYHELISLTEKLQRAKNLSVSVSEKPSKTEEGRSELVFLYKVVEGGTSKSYGIEVAKLAGLPKEVIMKARGVLLKLEQKTIDTGERMVENQTDMFGREANDDPHVYSERDHKALAELKSIDPDNLTPLEALKKIHELKEKGLI